ncbi:MAG: hypothetical protein IPL61_30755 [Myxococcales bacterium]|nr:hypothetical protein [Myxococcales bacterium]
MERFDDPDDLAYDLEVDGAQVRRELERRLWVRGGWATGVYRYQELDPATGAWRAPRVAVVRLRKVAGAWRKHAAIALTSTVAAELGAVLSAWSGAGAELLDDDDPA